jgi:hypothetical protein
MGGKLDARLRVVNGNVAIRYWLFAIRFGFGLRRPSAALNCMQGLHTEENLTDVRRIANSE